MESVYTCLRANNTCEVFPGPQRQAMIITDNLGRHDLMHGNMFAILTDILVRTGSKCWMKIQARPVTLSSGNGLGFSKSQKTSQSFSIVKIACYDFLNTLARCKGVESLPQMFRLLLIKGNQIFNQLSTGVCQYFSRS